MRTNNIVVYTALGAIIALFVIFAALQYWSMEEDAFILFRYAESLADGNGLYFNGDYGSPERVAGYSNVVWVLCLSAIAKTGIPTPAGARAVLLFIGSLNLILLYRLTKYITRSDSYVNLLPSILLAANVCYLWYAPGGMETALYIFFAISALLVFFYEEDNAVKFPYSAILFALLSMTHPEGPLYFLAAVAWRGAARWRDREVFLRDAVWFFTFWVVYFGFIIWHLGYYRDPFPTTFYNKGVGHPNKLSYGIKHLFRFFLDSRGYILFLPIVALFVGKKWDRFASIKWLVALFVLAGVGFILASGGDNKSHYRFIIPFVPFVFVLLAAGVVRLREWLSNRRALSIAVTAALVLVLVATNTVFFEDFVTGGNMLTANLIEFAKNPRYLTAKWRYSFTPHSDSPNAHVGKWMKANLPMGSYVATGQTGQIPYYAEMTCLDIMGFNDYVIQKIRMERNWGYNTYVLARRPDYLGDFDVMMPQYGDWLSPQPLIDDPRFYENYEILVIIDTEQMIRGEAFAKQRYVLFRRRDIPVELNDWDYRSAVEEFAAVEGNLIEYTCEYIYPPENYL
ncbi:MAG: hypothetical protein GY771_04285 [bacterium]|nr:hypothetical protein [bacterium]